MIKNLINLTPHPIQLWDGDECYLNIPATTGVPPARCEEKFEYIGTIGRTELVELTYSNVKNLPEPSNDTIYIVSVLVAQQFPNRYDLFVPYDLVRNENGSIIGCRKLARII